MSDFLNLIISHFPWFWLGVLVLALIFEALTFSLTTIWAAISAFLMIFLSRTGLPLRWQLLIFFLVAILLMVFTRPFAVKKLKLGRIATNVNSLDGQEVLVTKKITKFEKGEVKMALFGRRVQKGRGKLLKIQSVWSFVLKEILWL